MLAKVRSQAGLLAPRIQLERLVDRLLERALDPSIEQVSGLRACRSQLGDPLFEGLGARAELIEGQLDRARLEARCLRDLPCSASGKLGD